MSMPINPPEARPTVLADCEACEARGVIVEADGPESCSICDGLGQVEYSPEEDPYAPDYWKDAL